MMSRRIVITGNCGSGKTHLAKALSAALKVPFFRADRAVFKFEPAAPNPSGKRWNIERRSKEEARQLVTEFVAGGTWVFEGVYGRLIKQALERATHFVWLDLDPEFCRASMAERQEQLLRERPAELPPEVHHRLFDWARSYHQRDDHTARCFHAALFDEFNGQRHHLRNRTEVDALIARAAKEFPPLPTHVPSNESGTGFQPVIHGDHRLEAGATFPKRSLRRSE